MMDDAARRVLAFNIANNRTQTNVAEKAGALLDWMAALGAPGEAALIAANNQVSPQSSLAAILATATKNYEFMAGQNVPAAIAAAAVEAVTDKPPAPVVAEKGDK